MLNINNTFDKNLGYYTCDGISFGSKINACIYAQSVNKSVKWIFKNHIHDRYPWEIEPTETLDQLYDQRCKDLREKYDYLVLSYSGGSDSNNILESFMRQNLHIDEIVTNHLTQATEKTIILNPAVKDNWNFNAEHQLHALPRLREIQKKLPRTKITILDVTQAVLSSLDGQDESWLLNRRENVSIGMTHRYNHIYFNEVRKQLDKNLNVAIITGIEKPRTAIENGVFYVYFTDANVNASSPADHNIGTNAKIEYFYWNDPKIVVKQAHVVKRWLETNTQFQKFWQTGESLWENSRKIHEPLLKNIIYTTWNNEWFQTEKAVRGWYCEFDQWCHTNKDQIKNYHVWKKGLDYLTSAASNFIRYKNGEADGLITMSHRYKIGTMKDHH